MSIFYSKNETEKEIVYTYKLKRKTFSWTLVLWILIDITLIIFRQFILVNIINSAVVLIAFAMLFDVLPFMFQQRRTINKGKKITVQLENGYAKYTLEK